MENNTIEQMEAALVAIADMLARGEKAKEKFAPGTAQHTLQTNRSAALRIAAALIEQALGRHEAMEGFSREDFERAAAPIASLISKSEKAQQKLAPGSWQHAMLERNLGALRIGSSLLENALA